MAYMLPYHGYMVTSDGTVYRKGPAVKPLKQSISEKGYPVVYLSFNGKTKAAKVHRLVAELFVPNPERKKEINHKDGDKLNNKANNLEWCTRSENVKHSYEAGLHSTVSISAFNETGQIIGTFSSVKEAAAFCGAPGGSSHIVSAARGKRKSAYGYRWRYT